jgi:hypothetical protein
MPTGFGGRVTQADVDLAQRALTNAQQAQSIAPSVNATQAVAAAQAQLADVTDTFAAQQSFPLNPAFESTQQATVGSLPTLSDKVAELNVKLEDVPQANFTNLTPDIILQQTDGPVMAVSKDTKATVPTPLNGNQRSNTAAAAQAAAADSQADQTKEWKVTLVGSPAYNSQLGNSNTVVFNVMPRISESRSASYESMHPVHGPGEILRYQHTSTRTWGISAKLISRTPTEAQENLRIVNLIRSWVMPFFGQGTAMNKQTQQYLGAPPPIVTLSAYGDNMIGPVKCVVKSYNWSWSDDVDYLPTLNNTPFPVVVDIEISLEEGWSPAELSGFNIVNYRDGDMRTAFTAVQATAPAPPIAYVPVPTPAKAVSEPKRASLPANVATKQNAVVGITTGTVSSNTGSVAGRPRH